MTQDRRKGSVHDLPPGPRREGVCHEVQKKESGPAVLGEWAKWCG